jgi:hypothetical protein
VYAFTFIFVHPHADTNVCQLRLDDPLYRLVPHDARWHFVTHTVYAVVTVGAVLAMLVHGFVVDARIPVRFGLALAVSGAMRAVCILLMPLCRVNVAPGTVVLDHVPTVAMGPWHIPFRAWATNDMLFSGHVAESVLVLCVAAAARWPRPVRLLLWAFALLQIYGLLADRGHYTIDIVVAVPCALAADLAAVAVIRRFEASRSPAATRAAAEAARQPRVLLDPSNASAAGASVSAVVRQVSSPSVAAAPNDRMPPDADKSSDP